MDAESLKIRMKYIQTVVLILITAILIIPGMYSNFWKVSPDKIFRNAGRGSEYNIIGRLVYTRDHGIFSQGGIPGYLSPAPEAISNYDFQYEAYIHHLPYDEYHPHRSQLGFQVMPLYLIGAVTGLEGEEALNAFWFFTSVMLALTMLCLALWVKRYFGFFTAVLLLIAVFLSVWFNALGRNLWFVFWVHYLPLLAICYLCFREDQNRPVNWIWAAIIIYMTVLFRMMMTSFEFVTSSLFMPLVPLIFYAVYRRWSLNKFLKRFIGVGILSLLAVFTAMVILCFQISSIKGSFRDGAEYIIYSYNKRTSGDPEKFAFEPILPKSLKSSRSEVLKIYWQKEAMDPGFFLREKNSQKIICKVRYGDLVIFFLFVTLGGVLLKWKSKLRADSRLKLDAILLACWFSVIGPLSWYVIFKGHSFIHRGIDMSVWQMPFVFFGFMLTGYVIILALEQILRRTGPAPDDKAG